MASQSRHRLFRVPFPKTFPSHPPPENGRRTFLWTQTSLFSSPWTRGTPVDRPCRTTWRRCFVPWPWWYRTTRLSARSCCSVSVTWRTGSALRRWSRRSASARNSCPHRQGLGVIVRNKGLASSRWEHCPSTNIQVVAIFFRTSASLEGGDRWMSWSKCAFIKKHRSFAEYSRPHKTLGRTGWILWIHSTRAMANLQRHKLLVFYKNRTRCDTRRRLLHDNCAYHHHLSRTRFDPPYSSYPHHALIMIPSSCPHHALIMIPSSWYPATFTATSIRVIHTRSHGNLIIVTSSFATRAYAVTYAAAPPPLHETQGKIGGGGGMLRGAC